MEEKQDMKKKAKKRFSLGTFFKDGSMTRQLPLIILIAIFGILLVWNRYTVERLLREKKELQEQIDFLNEKSVEMQKTYQQSVRISRIAQELDSVGVKFISGPPYEIEN